MSYSERFPIPVHGNPADWPARPTTRTFRADLTRAGVVVASGVKVSATFTPPLPGIGRTDNTDAIPMARQTTIEREPKLGEWRVAIEGSDPGLCDGYGTEFGIVLQTGESAGVIMSEAHTDRKTCTLYCEGLGVPPRAFWLK